MRGRAGLVLVGVTILVLASACSRSNSAEQLVVKIPPGFSGNFDLEMGLKDAPALDREGDHYLLVVPKSGKVLTSTLLAKPQVTFQNASEGEVWGFSHSVFSTGDGITVGGKIEFFVGTKQEYDAQENRKHHSEGSQRFPELAGA